MPMDDLCVVYLARAQNGLEPTRRFAESYALCPGGAPHRLIVAFKGFDRESDADPYRALFGRVTDQDVFYQDDRGFDLRPPPDNGCERFGRELIACQPVIQILGYARKLSGRQGLNLARRCCRFGQHRLDQHKVVLGYGPGPP